MTLFGGGRGSGGKGGGSKLSQRMMVDEAFGAGLHQSILGSGICPQRLRQLCRSALPFFDRAVVALSARLYMTTWCMFSAAE
eukprot:6201024-Pleurochrysis_carterae.AAC.1